MNLRTFINLTTIALAANISYSETNGYVKFDNNKKYLQCGYRIGNDADDMLPQANLYIQASSKDGSLSLTNQLLPDYTIGTDFFLARDRFDSSYKTNLIAYKFQANYNWNQFAYYPNAQPTKTKTDKNSYDFKIGIIHFIATKNDSMRRTLQSSISYKRKWEASKEIGIVENKGTSMQIISNKVIDGPKISPTISFSGMAVGAINSIWDFGIGASLSFKSEADEFDPFSESQLLIGISPILVLDISDSFLKGVNNRVSAIPFLSVPASSEDDFSFGITMKLEIAAVSYDYE